MSPAEASRVLVVDDQVENLELVREILSLDGYEVVTSTGGEEALDEVESRAPDCVVLDVMMPGMDGIEVCRRLKSSRRTHFVPVVMLTSLAAVEDKVRAFRAGADDFLNKPVHSVELRARVRSLVRIKRLRDQLDTSESIIVSMIHALESKDSRNRGHSPRVARIALHLARRLGLSPERVEQVGKGALLHDLGKIGLPETLLDPTARLEDEDQAVYRRHATLGEEILAPLRSLRSVRQIVRHHHERLDGSGFPDGIGGEEFDEAQEIVALANRFDHLRSDGRDVDPVATLREDAKEGRYRPGTVEALIEVAPSIEWSGGVWEVLDRLPVRGTERRGRILVVGDVPSNRAVLSDVLREVGHEVLTWESPVDVAKMVDDERPDLVLLDARVSGGDGFTVCREIKEAPGSRFLPVILVKTHHAPGDRGLGAEAGADDFLLYPINRLELQARVASLLRLRLYFQDLEEYQAAILSLATALEAKDTYTRGHSERVGYLSVRLARELGLPEPDCEGMLVSGLLHDIGKIGVPEAVLNKAGRLTSEEFELVMTHPVLGEEICRPLQSARHALPVIRHHHERFDGSGYPDRLVGEAIPFQARILGVADAYDALTSKRSYRASLEPEAAVQLLVEEMTEGRWDPEVITALQRVLAQSRA